jgi:hypothetical protein
MLGDIIFMLIHYNVPDGTTINTKRGINKITVSLAFPGETVYNEVCGYLDELAPKVSHFG